MSTLAALDEWCADLAANIENLRKLEAAMAETAARDCRTECEE